MAENSAENSFVCERCGTAFTIKPEILARYPGWRPRVCLPCKDKAKAEETRTAQRSDAGVARVASAPGKKPSGTAKARARKALDRHTDGPKNGVFTDGACSGNPGPGGWAAVWVEDDRIVDEQHGSDPRTTNNRMELRALIAAYEMLPEDSTVTIFSDSNLCVQTINQWAAGWERRGWRRKSGPVENLELVKRAYQLSRRHPKVELRWIKAHAGSRWNEYADALATAPLGNKKQAGAPRS